MIEEYESLETSSYWQTTPPTHKGHAYVEELFVCNASQDMCAIVLTELFSCEVTVATDRISTWK